MAILTLRIGQAPPSAVLAGIGVAITLAGEALRLWGVHHIGAISRTRTDRLGPLVGRGPFGYVRNPLYVGNIALWIGFAVTARLLWLAPLILVMLGAEYHAIVRWEETLLEARLGDAYREYASRVPRWLPALSRGRPGEQAGPGGTRVPAPPAGSTVSLEAPRFSWRETLFSERGTLIAIAAGYLLLWTKARF